MGSSVPKILRLVHLRVIIQNKSYRNFHFIYAGYTMYGIENPPSSLYPPPEGDKGGGLGL